MNWKIDKITIDGKSRNSASWVTSGGTSISVSNTIFSGSFNVDVAKHFEWDDYEETAVITISAETGTRKNITLKRCMSDNN